MDVKADVSVDKKTFGIESDVVRGVLSNALTIARDFHRRIDAVSHLMVSAGFELARYTQILSRFKTSPSFPDDSFRADEIITRNDLLTDATTIENKMWDHVSWAFDAERRFK
jgi:hypothetical protein